MSTRALAPRNLLQVALVAAILALTVLLAGCTSSGEDSATVGGAEPAYDQAAPAEIGADEAWEESADGEAGTSTSDTGDSTDRAVIVTGAMYMTVEDPLGAADRATTIVEDAGGRVDARNERAASDYDGGSAYLTLRIPAVGLDVVVEDLRALGTVDEFQTSSYDVSREVTDLDLRISTLRASTDRIAALLDEAQDIEDIIALETELAQRQAELESLEARQRGLDDQVSMSTIDLSLTTEPIVIVDDSPRSFWDGLVSGWEALVRFLEGALVVTGVLLPWLGAALLVGMAALLVVRSARSRRRAAREASAAAGAAPGGRDALGGQDPPASR
ncbi:DUF4349 domain-containing protein [Demequina pelophila]|uniref:DUF4349 domain-containing protein n=1 Tax=Demequina pelophila TaxID=1638984 RepID=UPI0007818562|nr:DUF4349 domain-containing protein [Demequina pelophila]